jgi:uncharacterized protein (DUF2384 family)
VERALKTPSKPGWSLTLPPLERLREPEALIDTHPLLEQLVRGFGSNAVARLVDVSPATVTNWRSRKRSMAPSYARRVADVHYVLTRAFQTFRPDTAMQWLVSVDPFLEAQRPIDVLVLQGPARLIAALDAHEAGAYP